MKTTSLNLRSSFKPSSTSVAWLFFLSLLLASSHALYTVRDFHSIWPWEYKGDGLYEVDIGINRGTDAANTTLSDGTIVLAMGDINDNKHNDLITMADDQKTVTINFFNTDNAKFGNQKELTTGSCITSAAYIIASPDYRIALLCTENVGYDYVKLFMNDRDFTSMDLSELKIRKGSQPLFMDINSDTFVDLVFNQNTNTGSDDLRVSLYNADSKDFETNTLGLLDTYVIENPAIGCQNVPNKQQLILANPSFSTLVDFNSDWVSDLYLNVVNTAGMNMGLTFITTRTRSNNEEFMRLCLVDTDDLTTLTSPVFADFNNDGSIDKGYFNTIDKSIDIYYNQHSSNGPSASSLCKSMPIIEENESKTKFEDYKFFNGTADVTDLQNVARLYGSTSMVGDFIPGQLRVSDLDSNGYPDIILTVEKLDGSVVTSILISSECGTDTVTNANHELKTSPSSCSERTFTSDNDYSSISDFKNTLYGFLLDFDDNGRMDIVLVSKRSDGITELISFYNNFARDSYYITATSYTTSGSAFGSKVYGVSYRGVYTNLNDKNKVFVSTQLTRTAYGALESPVATYAIGRSNNYIEDFTATYPIQKFTNVGNKKELSREINTWTPIIPNSHLLINLSGKTSNKWGIKLLINPTDSFILVGIILTLILIIIGGVIIYMHVQEKKEDDKSRDKQLDFF